MAQQQRLATETTDERTARLQHKTVAQQQRLAAESLEERTVRLDHLHQNKIAAQHSASQEAHIPLLEQKCVNDKMAKFHKDIAALSSPTCITCMEAFPGLKVSSRSECVRCSRDKHTPKLYSMANNMNPGPVPCELQVREQKFMTDSITMNIGSVTGRGVAYLSSDTFHVHLSPPARAVWIQGARHQHASGSVCVCH